MAVKEHERDKVGTFWDHISELSARLRIVFYCVVAATIFFMVFPANTSFLANPLAFYDPVIALVLRQVTTDVLPPGMQLIAGEITAPLEIYLVSSVILGIAASMPIIAYELYRYVDPALYPEERSAVYPFVLSFTVLFVMGGAFGYRVLTPFMMWAMIPFFTLAGASPIIYVIDFYNIVFVTTLATGFSFTLPVFFVLLVKFGIVKTSFVTARRPYIYGALYIITAIITPDGGPLADAALFLPMVVLLELAVLVSRRYEKRPAEVSRVTGEKAVYTKCKFCGNLVESTSSFCPACGKSQV